MIGREAVDCVVTWSIDRLGRSMFRSMFDTLSTIQDLESKGVKVISIKGKRLQTLDDNVRKLILSVLAWIAEWERRRIRETGRNMVLR